MTHTELKKIVDSGDYCIQCPADQYTNKKWIEFIESFFCKYNCTDWYYSPMPFSDGLLLCQTPESKTVLTLDEWWDAVHGEDKKLYTIKNLADGKVACVNDGTVDELRWVMDASGGKLYDNKQIIGDCKYYYINHDKEILADVVLPNLPTQSVKDFVKQLGKSEPAQWQPQPGELVEVSDAEVNWVEAVFHVMVNGWYVVADNVNSVPVGYKHCRPINKYHTPTIEELKQAYAQVHGVDVELVKISDK